jgi:hypothetical protein
MQSPDSEPFATGGTMDTDTDRRLLDVVNRVYEARGQIVVTGEK